MYKTIENELIPGLHKNIEKRKRDNVSKIDDIKNHMNKENNFIMKTISIKEAAKVGNTSERNIQVQMCDSGWFEKTEQKGVYRLLSEKRDRRFKTKTITEPKQQMNDGIKKDTEKKDKIINNLKEISELEFADKENPIKQLTNIPLRLNKNEPKKLIKKTTFYCPHCNLEVLNE